MRKIVLFSDCLLCVKLTKFIFKVKHVGNNESRHEHQIV